MVMKRKLYVTATAVMTALSMVACSSSNSAPATEGATKAQAADTKAAESTPETEAAETADVSTLEGWGLL